MKIVIAGAGNVGIHLAKLLAGENQDIVLIDESPEKLARLDSSFDLLTIQESPVLKDHVFAKIDWVRQYLKREGIDKNDDL